MSVSTTRSSRSLRLLRRRPDAHFGGRVALFGLLIGVSLPAAGQEQPFSHVDDEILHLTPVSRQLDYIRFTPALGTLKPMHGHTSFFSFDTVLLPAATWMDDDPDSSVKRHLATASDIRHSVLPQTNPHGTLSILLKGNGETPLDSEDGQAEFRSNGPVLSSASNPDSEVPISGSWTAIPLVLTLSQWVLRLHRRRPGNPSDLAG